MQDEGEMVCDSLKCWVTVEISCGSFWSVLDKGGHENIKKFDRGHDS